MVQNPVPEPEDWDMVIEARSPWFHLGLKELWHYRDLLVLMVKRDFSAQYKQTVLGPVWHLLQPLLTTAMFLMLFTRIAKIPTDGINPVLFYLSGLTVWNYFAACLNGTAGTFVANAGIFGKVYFPRLVVPLAVVLSNVVRFLIQFAILLVAMAWFYFKGETIFFGRVFLFLPFLLLLLAGIGLGLGLLISSLTTKYRDFGVLVSFGVQLLLYATPIAYPLSYLEGSGLAGVIQLNPLSGIAEAFRYLLFGQGTISWGALAYSLGFMSLVLFTGLIVFNQVEKKFMDTV